MFAGSRSCWRQRWGTGKRKSWQDWQRRRWPQLFWCQQKCGEFCDESRFMDYVMLGRSSGSQIDPVNKKSGQFIQAKLMQPHVCDSSDRRHSCTVLSPSTHVAVFVGDHPDKMSDTLGKKTISDAKLSKIKYQVWTWTRTQSARVKFVCSGHVRF